LAGSGQAARILRERAAALSELLDRSAPAPPAGNARLAVQIFDGGSMPTTAEKYFLGHPVTFTAPSCEGCGDAGTVDTDTSVPVLVLRGVPKVGDILVAYGVGGRWVAELGGTTKPDCCACGWPCGSSTHVPSYILVTDPIYGVFKLPATNLGGQCKYYLDTYLSFAGNGQCPAGQVPVHMEIIGAGTPTATFQMWINDQGNVNGCTGSGGATTPCDCPAPNFIHAGACTGNADPNLMLMLCPTNVNTFPVGLWNQDQCGTARNGVSFALDCTKILDPSMPVFSVQGYVGMMCVDGLATNPFYLLYGGCPAPFFGPTSSMCGVQPKWTFQAGPPKSVCSWFCSNSVSHPLTGDGPEKLTVTMSTYGTFTLPKVCSPRPFMPQAQAIAQTTPWYYYLATTIKYPGNGVCASVDKVPVCIEVFWDQNGGVWFYMLFPAGLAQDGSCPPDCWIITTTKINCPQDHIVVNQPGVVWTNPCLPPVQIPNPGAALDHFAFGMTCGKTRPWSYHADFIMCPYGFYTVGSPTLAPPTWACKCINEGGAAGSPSTAYVLFGGTCTAGADPPRIPVSVTISE
jgi:hypothetical protein